MELNIHNKKIIDMRIFNNRKNIILVVLVLFSVILPLAFFAFSSMESSVIIDNEQIRITGIYGERIPIEQVKQVFLADSLPNITLRTNVISIGRINKGYFRSSSLQKNVKLLLHTRGAPYLYIIYGDNNKHVILNFRNREKTLEVYEKLRRLVGE
jgi:hypothetical protein